MKTYYNLKNKEKNLMFIQQIILLHIKLLINFIFQQTFNDQIQLYNIFSNYIYIPQFFFFFKPQLRICQNIYSNNKILQIIIIFNQYINKLFYDVLYQSKSNSKNFSGSSQNLNYNNFYHFRYQRDLLTLLYLITLIQNQRLNKNNIYSIIKTDECKFLIF
ncbi:hypothetical protein pb186bvf_015215 [Paramecium bursaria]